MRRFLPILGVVILVMLLVLVNRGINRVAKPDTDDDDAAKSQQTSPAKPTAAGGSVPAAPSGPPPEITVGSPATAKYRVTVGWVYDEANQANPQALQDALQTVQTIVQGSKGAASAEIVDVDLPTDVLSPSAAGVSGVGVAVNGQSVEDIDPGEPGATAKDLAAALQQRLSGK